MRLNIPHTWSMTYEFACKDKSCAPPPVGTGGSSAGKASGKIPVSETRAGQRVLFGKSGLDVSSMTPDYEYRPHGSVPPLKGEFTIKKITPVRAGVSMGMKKKSGTAYHLEVVDSDGVSHYTRFPSQSKLTVID